MNFKDYLLSKKGKKIFLEPCSGNNGDLLILLGMKAVLKSKNVNLTDKADDADVIIINGGGMFIDAYSQGLDKISFYTEKYPQTELCIAPNSFGFKKVDFSKYLTKRKAKLVIFYRERYSGAYIEKLIQEISNVVAYLDHDLAFHLEGDLFINDILMQYPNPIKGNVLVVDRKDIEHSNVGVISTYSRKLYFKFVPDFIKNIVRKNRANNSQRESYFTKVAKNKILEIDPLYEFHNIETADISRIDVCDFESFIKKIAESEYVFTNRLHVGILAHLLNRNTYMAEGSYHKMTGIYEYSMSNKKETNII